MRDFSSVIGGSGVLFGDEGVDEFDEFGEFDGFHEVMIEPGVSGSFACVVFTVSCEPDDQDITGFRVGSEFGGDLITVKDRQADIEQDEPWTQLSRGFNSIAAVVRDDDIESREFEERCDRRGGVEVIVDDEDFGFERRRGAIGSDSMSIADDLLFFGRGEFDDEFTSRSDPLASDMYLSLVDFDKFFHEGQADAKASARPMQRAFNLREGLEDTALHILRYTDAVIFDADRDELGCSRERKFDAAARLGILDGVAQQVDENLFDSSGIGLDRGKTVVDRADELVAAFVGERRDSLDGAASDLGGVENAFAKLYFSLGDSRHVEEVVNQM